MARSFGDLSENAEYDAARNEQAQVEARILELEELISNATVVDESAIKHDSVNVGSMVKVYEVEYDEEVEYSIVGSNEANPMLGKISDQSPVGSALIGAKAGDEVIAEVPIGQLHLRVLEVSRAKPTKNRERVVRCAPFLGQWAGVAGLRKTVKRAKIDKVRDGNARQASGRGNSGQ